MKTYIRILVALLVVNIAAAQEIKYVNANNGLVLRDQPNRGSHKIATLDYGSQIEIIEQTDLKLDVKDNNKVVSGTWLKVRAIDYPGYIEDGYVFSGFLTDEVLKRRFKISFDAFTLSIDNLNANREEGHGFKKEQDTLNIVLDVGESFEEKNIRIKHHIGYRNIQVFQKHENSVTIMNEGPHCDLMNWKHFYSSWKPLRKGTKKNSFNSVSYKENDWERFIDVDLNELKKVVNEECGEQWGDLIKDIKSVNEYPSGVSISKIFFKVILTDLEGEKIEKIIAFEMAMGC